MELLEERNQNVEQSSEKWELRELPFVGREAELKAATCILQEAATLRTPSGRLVLISGEEGIGKTRLAQELISFANSTGYLTLRAKCRKSPQSTASYSPWIDLIRQFSSQASAQSFFRACGPNVYKIVRLVPELSESIEDPERSGVSASEASARETLIAASTSAPRSPEEIQKEELLFLQSIAQLFFRTAEESPLFLVLDDLQWCDNASVGLLRTLLFSDAFQKLPIVILGLYRDLEGDLRSNQALGSLISDLAGPESGVACNLRLKRLDKKSVSQLVGRLFSFCPVEDPGMEELQELVFSRSGGNPLFVEEVLRCLAEQNIIVRSSDEKWVASSEMANLLLPDSLRSLIKHRLSYLDDETVDLLRVASVFGEKFSSTILEDVVNRSFAVCRRPVLESLRIASQTRLVSEIELPADGDFMFSDESVVEALYDELDPSRSKYYHGLTARSLEAHYQREGANSIKEHSTSLARHYLEGEDLEKAREYFIISAKRASELYAHSEAFSNYESALSTLGSGREAAALQRADLLKSMGDESQFLTQIDRTLECWKDAAALYEKCGEKLKAAVVLTKLGVFFHVVLYDLVESKSALQRAFDLALEYGDNPSSELSRIIAWSVVGDIWMGERQKVIEKSAIATRLATESGAHDILAMLNSFVIATDLASVVEESIKSCDRGIEICRQHGFLLEGSYDYFHRAVAYSYTCGPSQKSLELFLEGLDFTAKSGNFMVNLFHKTELVYAVYLPQGEWRKARELANEALAVTRQFPPTSLFVLISEATMGQVLLHEGDLEAAEGYLECVRKSTKGFGILQLDVPLYIALAKVNIAKGDFYKAQEYLEEGYRLSKRRGLTVINAVPHVQLLSLMIEFYLSRRGDGEDDDIERSIDKTLAELLESTNEIKQEWPSAYCYRAIGSVAGTRGEVEKAVSSFQKSIEIFGKLGWTYELARTKVQSGVVGLGGGNNNVLSALKLFDSALETFTKLGARRDVEFVSAMKKRLEEQELPLFDSPPSFVNAESELVFHKLASEFMMDLTTKKVEPEKCGWRSYSELQRKLNLSRYLFYGRSRAKGGPVMRELLSSGLIETRIFEGHRGRGGAITKIRVNLAKNRKSTT